jgi:AcrR family transcriptional regulator
MAQKPDTTEDLRVLRTRKLLQQALIELTVEKGFAAITVRDITKRAMVNRSTFYRHYLDKFDLLEQYMNELFGLTSEESFIAEKLGPTSAEGPSGLVSLLKHVQKFADFYRVMLGTKGDPAFTERFRQNSEKRFRTLLSHMALEPNALPVDLRLSYASYAGVGAIVWWLQHGQPCTPEQLAIWLGNLSKGSVGLVATPNDNSARPN